MIIIIIEYYEEFSENFPKLWPKTVKGFEAYIREHHIPRSEIYDSVGAYVDMLPLATTTRSNYRRILRRYVEEISRNYW